MEGKTMTKVVSFLDVFEGGRYKDFSSPKQKIIKLSEVFKQFKVPVAKQFSIKVSPMPYWDLNTATEAEHAYEMATDTHIILDSIGKTLDDLWPKKDTNGKTNYKEFNASLMLEVLSIKGKTEASKKYHRAVYDVVQEYADAVVLKGGAEEPFSDVIEAFSQNSAYMEALFREIIKASRMTENEAGPVK